MLWQRKGSREAFTESQGAIHIAAILAVVLLGLTLALVSPAELRSATQGSIEEATPIDRLPFLDEGVDVSTADVEPDEPRPSCGPMENTVWYALNLEGDTPLSVRVVPEQGSPSAFDIALAAWTLEPDGSLSEIGCVDDRVADSPEQLVFTLAGEATNYLQVGAAAGPDTNAGVFTLLADVQRPEHDLFAFARPIGTKTYRDLDVDSIDARSEPGEPNPSCAELAATTWYRLSAPEDAILSASVVPSVIGGGSMDFALAVYAGDSIDSLVEVACVDTAGVEEPERVEVALERGEEYAIQVGTILGGEAWPGTFSLLVGGRQGIEFEAVPDTVFGADPLPLAAAAGSGLGVELTAEGPCSILDGRLVTDGAGSCTITASQPGDIDWAPAPDVLLAIDIAKASQAIEFEAVPDTVFGADPLPL
ncbi:MAG: hypothetical protein ACC726_11115, partial [Chloroflexota bacterium]